MNGESGNPRNSSDPRIQVKKSPAPSKSFLLLCVLLVCLAGFAFLASRNATKNGTESVAVGQEMPAIELKPLTGEGQDLRLEQLDGRVTMINFWGSWCPPCVKEFPHMVNIRRELGVHEDFQFVSVSCLQRPTGNESSLREQTLQFMDYTNARLPTHSDLEVKTRTGLASTFESDNLPFPATVLIDRQRVIRGLWLGYLPGDEKGMKEAAMRVLMKGE